MSKLDAALRTTNGTLAIPAHAMGATLGRAGEVGLEDYELYVLGRGGTMGEVKADVIASALTWFEPSWVQAMYTSGLAKISMAEATVAWASRVDGWAEEGLSEDLPLTRLCELLGRVIVAANPAVAPIFAGWRQLPEPASLPSLAMHRLYALRELRAGLHAGAVRAAGLLPLEALLVRTPALAPGWGWTEPYPDVSGCFDAWRSAEDGTNQAVARLFDCLSDAETDELADAVDATLEHTGMLWWFEDGSPTIMFGPQPGE